MPATFRKCKICGVEYPYCKTALRDDVFRYQDVACCPEHGSMYLAKILESRGIKPKTNVEEAHSSVVDKCDAPAPQDIEDDDDYDFFDDDDYNEEDDEEDVELW